MRNISTNKSTLYWSWCYPVKYQPTNYHSALFCDHSPFCQSAPSPSVYLHLYLSLFCHWSLVYIFRCMLFWCLLVFEFYCFLVVFKWCSCFCLFAFLFSIFSLFSTFSVYSFDLCFSASWPCLLFWLVRCLVSLTKFTVTTSSIWKAKGRAVSWVNKLFFLRFTFFVRQIHVWSGRQEGRKEWKKRTGWEER